LDLGVDALAGSAALDLVYLGRDSLVGQTAMLDGAAEAAALNGTAQGDGAATPMVV
jgi:flagellar hook-length control protein FliK